MNAYCRPITETINTQEKSNAAALERAEALLKKLEERISDNTYNTPKISPTLLLDANI